MAIQRNKAASFTLSAITTLVLFAAGPSVSRAQSSQVSPELRAGLIQLRDGNTQAATAAFRGILRRDSTDVRAWAYLATAQKELGRYSAARASVNRSLALSPAYRYALNLRDELRNLQGGATVRRRMATRRQRTADSLEAVRVERERRAAAVRQREAERRRRAAAARRREADRRAAEEASRPKQSMFDVIMGTMQTMTDQLQRQTDSLKRENDALMRTRMRQLEDEKRQREAAAQRAREAEVERQREAQRRRTAGSTDATRRSSGLANVGTRRAQEEQRQREEERRRQQVEAERRQQAELESQRREQQQRAARAQQRAADDAAAERQRRAQYYPACRNLPETGDFAWRLPKCQKWEALRANSRTITITIHHNCAQTADADVSVFLELEGLIEATSSVTGAWIGGESGWAGGGPQVSRSDLGTISYGSIGWKRVTITYDTRRYSVGPHVGFRWTVDRFRSGGGRDKGTQQISVADGGVYSFQGGSTGSIPNCAR